MDKLHGLLRRQWQRFFGRDKEPPEESLPFLRAVSEAYVELDNARRMVERALELSSGELHAANAELRGVLHVLPDVLFRVRADNEVTGVMGSTAVTHASLRALSSGPSAVVERFQHTLAHARETKAPVAFEYIHTDDGRTVHYEVRLLPFVDDDIIGIVRDVTEHKQSEQDRLILGKLESTGILAGGIAHDFNNLLTSMLLNVDMAALPETVPAEMDEYLSAIRSGVSAAQVLTQQLITFARGGTDVREPVVLDGLLRESVLIVLSGSNLRVEMSVDEHLWATHVDAGQIGQVIRNLVLNARESMPEGGVVGVRARNVVLNGDNSSALPPGTYVEVAVADEGHGIPTELLPRIFDPYFSTKMRGTQKGMGLGLTICHSVVQKHGGAITIESAVGRGTTFRVMLPACDKATRDACESLTADAAPNVHGRILVMDDEPLVLRAFASVLKQLGYETSLVPNGSDAVRAYAQAQDEGQPFDAVILDLTVKGDMGGREAAEKLLVLDPDARAIVMSGYSDDSVVREFQQFGFKARLTKPFDRDAVRDVLRDVLAAV